MTAAFCAPLLASAQSTLNFGIRRRQGAEDLPKTKAPIENVVRKQKENRKALLAPAKDGEYILTQGWELINADSVVSKPFFDAGYDTSDWYNAVVPGTVLTTLVEQGVYPDPYYGLNNLRIPDSLARTNWWYRIQFDAPAEKSGKNTRLLFNGINYRADIWLNGKFIGKMVGAFRRGEFDVTGVMKDRGNVLAVHIFPPDNPGIGHEQNARDFGPNGGALCLDGPTFIASEGWDWMPAIRDRNMGIWQDVRLKYNNGILIGDPQVITDLDLPDTTRADITVKVPLINTTQEKREVRITGEGEGIGFGQNLTLAPGETYEFSTRVTLDNPRLWWPNGYGAQNLYDLKLSLSDGTSKSVRFGIRELSYALMVDTPEKEGVRIEYTPTNVRQKGKILFDYKKLRDANVPNKNTFTPSLTQGTEMENFTVVEGDDNPYLVILVNGRKIYCRGGDWGMDDAMKRCSRERLEPAMKLHKLAGFNMIRNWTGEQTEEVLFELCDEYGLLVWNDFWMSTGAYNLLPLDWDLFLSNATDVVRRFRNHPSIAIWCPRNEGYAEGLEDDLQNIILTEDGTRHYHGNSRVLNMPGSGPWGYHDRATEYFTRLPYGFNSELGSNSVPPYRTFRKFIPKEDEWPIGDLWYYHDYHVKGWSGWDAFERDLAKLSKHKIESAEEYCDRSQVLNYNGHKIMLEGYNSKMWNDVSGVLYWITQPAWPSLICQAYTWDYDTFGTFYGMKKACEPTHIQWIITDHRVKVVNASLASYKNATASMRVYTLDGKLLSSKEQKVDVKSNDRNDLWVGTLPASNEILLLRLELRDSRNKIISENDYFVKKEYSNAPEGLWDIKEVGLELSCKPTKDNRIEVSVKNRGKNVAGYVAVRLAYSATGDSVLPCYTSDNYFNLLPGETRRVTIDHPSIPFKGLMVEAEGINCLQKTDLR